MRTVARNVAIKVTVPRDVTVNQVLGKDFRHIDDRTVEVLLPDAESGTDITSLWELEVNAHRAGIFRIARADLSFDESATGRRTGGAIDVPIEFTRDAGLVGANISKRVQDEIAISKMTRELDKTLMVGRTQAMDAKTVLGDLHRTQTLLLQNGRTLLAGQINEAMTGIQNGDSVEKTLMGTIYQLELGKNSTPNS
jgi:hypothetical protein